MFKSGLLTWESPCKSKQVDVEFVTLFEKMQKGSMKQTKQVARISEISGVHFFSLWYDNFAKSGETFIETIVSIMSRLAKLDSFLVGSQCDEYIFITSETFIHILL